MSVSPDLLDKLDCAHLSHGPNRFLGGIPYGDCYEGIFLPIGYRPLRYLCEELGSLEGEGGNRCDSDFAWHGGTYCTIRCICILSMRAGLCRVCQRPCRAWQKREKRRGVGLFWRGRWLEGLCPGCEAGHRPGAQGVPGAAHPYFWAQHGLFCRPILYRAVWQ